MSGSSRNQSISDLETARDRRDSTRTIALFRPGLIESENNNSFCLVRNISATGLMASIHAPLENGAPISVRLSEHEVLHGKVVWQKDERTGVEFDEEVDVEAILSGIAGNKGGRDGYRPPRLKLKASAQFIVHGVGKEFQVEDISQRGLKGSIDGVLTGEEGTIVLPGLQPRRAAVRWAKDGYAGFYFLELVPFADLGQWVLNRSEHGQAYEIDA